MTVAARIRRLTLTNFRNYHEAAHCARSPHDRLGRAQRRRKDQHSGGDFLFDAGSRTALRDAGRSCFQRGRRIMGGVGGGRRRVRVVTLGTGIDSGHVTRPKLRRAGRGIDREPVTFRRRHLPIICGVLWLVPAMDGLFTGPASDRRRFLDRLVLAIERSTAARVSALERALRSRNRLLGKPGQTSIGSTRSSTRLLNSRLRSRRRAPKRWSCLATRWRRATIRCFRPRRSRSMAGWRRWY